MSNPVQSLVKEISSLTVVQLAELTKALETALGVSAAMPFMGAAPASGAAAPAQAAQEEKSEFKVELLDGGAEKIKVIKELRKVKKDLGLTEAKAMVDSASSQSPILIAEALSKADAQAVKDALEATGAKVRIA